MLSRGAFVRGGLRREWAATFWDEFMRVPRVRLALPGTRVGNAGLRAVADHCKALERLNVAYCAGVDGEGSTNPRGRWPEVGGGAPFPRSRAWGGAHMTEHQLLSATKIY